MPHVTKALVVLLAISSCRSASNASHDAAPMDTTPSEPGPTSPIVDFRLNDSKECDGGAFACDQYASAARTGHILYQYGFQSGYTATFTDQDRNRFVRFLDDPTTIASVWDTTPCPPLALGSRRTVTLRLENDQVIERIIDGCTGPPFEAMEQWAETIKAYSFNRDAAAPDASVMDGPRDTTPSEPAPTSPIVTFALNYWNWSGGIPGAFDENFSATRAGNITYSYGYQLGKAGTFTDEDRARFILFLDDPATIAGAWDTTPCPMGPSDSNTTLRLTLENGQEVSRVIHGCRGVPYDAVEGWATTIRDYFQ